MNLTGIKALTLTLALTPGLTAAVAQTLDTGAKQDMKNAGHSTQNAAVSAGHGIKKGTKKGYHKTKHATKKLGHKIEGKKTPHSTTHSDAFRPGTTA